MDGVEWNAIRQNDQPCNNEKNGKEGETLHCIADNEIRCLICLVLEVSCHQTRRCFANGVNPTEIASANFLKMFNVVDEQPEEIVARDDDSDCRSNSEADWNLLNIFDNNMSPKFGILNIFFAAKLSKINAEDQ